jgi:septal ring factor EnvC (AmiA/AmiB activator)
MKRCASLPVWALVLWLLLPAAAAAQSRQSLEQKKNKLQKEIAEANKLLGQLSRDKKTSIRQITALNRKIAARRELIATINREIGVLDGDIAGTRREIGALGRQMDELRENYARMVRSAQRSSNRHERLMYLFAAEDFNQAVRRVKFMRQINDTRRAQAAAIDSTRRLLATQQEELEARRKEKAGLLDSETQQKNQLDRERQNKDKMLTRLKARRPR